MTESAEKNFPAYSHLPKMVGNQAKGSEYASRILVTVNEAKPDEQLKAEFDKVNLDHSVRVAKCAQLGKVRTSS